MARTPARHHTCPRCGARLARDNDSGRCTPCHTAERDRLTTPPTLPATFWDHEPIRQALHERHLGKVVRAYRYHPYHGRLALPQDLVARWLGITQAQLSRAENSPPMIHLDRLIHWAQLLHIPAHLLWFKLQDTSDGRNDASAPAPPPTELRGVHADLELSGVQREMRPMDGQGLNKRSIVDGSLSEVIMMATEESARFVRRTTGVVDLSIVDQLSADVRQLAVDYLSRPPYLMLRPLAQLRSNAFALLEERQRPHVLTELYRVAGQLCALLAHACTDLGQSHPAETHARSAWLCAEFADDNPLRSYVRWVQANLAYWNGDYRQAAEIAHSGQRYVSAGSSLVRLASQEARAHAAAAEQRSAERALSIAQDARSHVTSDTDEPAGVFHFAPGKAAYYASEVLIALGDEDRLRRAVTEAQHALELFAAQPPTERCPEFIAAAQLDLVSAHLALNDLDGATEHLRPVLGLPTEKRTLPIAQRMANTGKTLSDTRFAGSISARDLTEQIALFCAYPATRELPSLPS
ncbi:hypothetical protein GCM10027280_31430 [Micromonospora polyrhachis]|uniref:DNA-binding protein n=1 Tax=Micromonospora polyrhachis TaxID=1282883 RepID=A0A7W7SWX5_9ACTN|nr:hypothetical protein [Micromonospora polyrhachis]MBB4961170.1 hypothetical protein [Micromonospora polyrhachis]